MDGKSKVQTAELTPSWFCSTALPTEHASPHNDQFFDQAFRVSRPLNCMKS